MSAVIAGVLILATLLGAPLFAVIGAGALVGFEREGVDVSVVAIEFFGLSETPVLVAIPLFTFAGFLLSAGQAPARLVRLSQALLGWRPKVQLKDGLRRTIAYFEGLLKEGDPLIVGR